MHVAATIEKQKETFVDGLPAVYRGITATSAVGSRRVVALCEFLNFDYDFKLQRLPEKEVRSMLVSNGGLPCGGATNVPRQRLASQSLI